MSLQALTMPMFPLGSVLLPSGVLPLHIFEPRYRALVHDILEGDREFGVVLISQGSEVGGGERRNHVGTVAEIREHELLDDGRSALIASGTDRIEVVGWLPDDPYPRAEVVRLAELPWTAEATAGLRQAREALDRLLLSAHKHGRLSDVPVVELAADEPAAAWQLMDLSPVGPLDRQRLLETLDPVERLSLLQGLLDDLRGDLEQASELDT